MKTIDLEEKARSLRADIVKMIYLAQSGHPGGSLSALEILMAIYYKTARVDPKNPKWDGRDRIVLSKGHACPAQYAILADLGFFDRDLLWTLRQLHSPLQGHPDYSKCPGIDVNMGSLGQGVSIAGGLALAGKILKKNYRVFAVTGDGESEEGLVWEAAESAAHYKLDNLTVILDHNGMQIDGTNNEVMGIGNMMDKYRDFGFKCVQVKNGNDVESIAKALKTEHKGQPLFICCETHKGNGVSLMQDQVKWHGKAPNEEQFHQIMNELGVAE